LDQLNVYWPSYDGPNNAFWSHEYEKHGTCAASLSQFATQLDFFKSTLSLLQKYNVLPMLAAAGIVPSDSNSVSASAATTAVTNAFGGKPAWECQSGNLDAVYLCLDKSLNPIDCTLVKSTCGSSFMLPASQQ
jgi:ribonuclease T2